MSCHRPLSPINPPEIKVHEQIAIVTSPLVILTARLLWVVVLPNVGHLWQIFWLFRFNFEPRRGYYDGFSYFSRQFEPKPEDPFFLLRRAPWTALPTMFCPSHSLKTALRNASKTQSSNRKSLYILLLLNIEFLVFLLSNVYL